MAHRAHLEFYRGNFSESKRLYEKARSSGKERGDKNMLNRCNAGIAGILLATNALQGALDLLRETNSYGQLALCYLRKGERQQALEKALQTKDRFKGKRTKYYVLKGFTSTAEVILKLLEDAILRRRRTDALSSTQSLSVAPDGSPAGRSRRNSLTRANSRVSRAVASRLTKVGRQSTAIGDAASGGRGVQVGDLTKLQEIAEEWIEKLSQFSNVYAVAQNSDSIVHWDRDISTGALTNQVNLIDATNLDGARSVTVSPDGKNVYAVAAPEPGLHAGSAAASPWHARVDDARADAYHCR